MEYNYKGRAQCIVVRDDKVLMVKHKHSETEWNYCIPGGGIEKDEKPEQAALRELQEECLVTGTIIKQTSVYVDPYDNTNSFYTYHIDIGEQIPALGEDPEIIDNPILVDVKWIKFNELSERDRAYLWSAGLICIEKFAGELESWNDDISYPNKKGS